MKDALLVKEDCNVILVDWSKGARFPYGRASGNTRLVGAQTAELIRFLISSSSGSTGFAKRFYIVGFSLGAVIAGYTGSNLKERGMKLGRITGMNETACLTEVNFKTFHFIGYKHYQTCIICIIIMSSGSLSAYPFFGLQGHFRKQIK